MSERPGWLTQWWSDVNDLPMPSFAIAMLFTLIVWTVIALVAVPIWVYRTARRPIR